MRRAALLGLAVALVSAPSAAGAHVVRRAQLGDVVAVLSYDRSSEAVFSSIHLRIERAGVHTFSASVPTDCPRCPLAGPAGARPLSARDLDADAEPEVLVDMYTGGAHCCAFTLIYRFLEGVGSYARTRAWWGNVGYRIADLDHDGQPELSSFDDRFAYAFTAFAFSVDPIRIRRFEHGRLVDVTRSFGSLVVRDAHRVRALYDRARRRHHDVRGVLAAYVADQSLLGRSAVGWRLVNAALRRGELERSRVNAAYPAGRRYVAALRRFLRRTGYST